MNIKSGLLIIPLIFLLTACNSYIVRPAHSVYYYPYNGQSRIHYYPNYYQKSGRVYRPFIRPRPGPVYPGYPYYQNNTDNQRIQPTGGPVPVPSGNPRIQPNNNAASAPLSSTAQSNSRIQPMSIATTSSQPISQAKPIAPKDQKIEDANKNINPITAKAISAAEDLNNRLHH